MKSVIGAIAGLLIGCASIDFITPDEYTEASSKCAPHAGLEVITGIDRVQSNLKTMTAKCKDQTKVSWMLRGRS